MAINATDVKLYESQRLTDDPDGGGRATGNEVVDGAVNNLFPDISRLDRTIGDVALRKVFVGIATANKDVYLGAHAILTKTPADPRARVLLFNTDSESDERSDARNYIENYVVKGARASWELLGNQLQGQRVIVGIQREEQKLPEVGDVYTLVDGNNEQYVRITEIEHVLETFTYEQSPSTYVDFQRRKLTMYISAPLENEFPGGEAKPSGTSAPKSDVYTTQVADAAKYYGATTTTNAAQIGDITVNVASVYENLVPSAQSESAVIDTPAGYNKPGYVESAANTVTESASSGVTTNTNESYIYLTRLPKPGSLTLTLHGGNVYQDNGKGGFTFQSGSNNFVLTVDYETGIIGKKTTGGAYSSSGYAAEYQPVGRIAGPAETGSEPITEVNRGYVYTLSLSTAKPRPGSFTFAYLALGKWQELADNGDGTLSGAGTGTVDYSTGSVNMTLAALPDSGSSLVWNYQANRINEYSAGDGSITIEPKFNINLNPGVKPTTAQFSWTQNAVAKTASDDGLGNITGDATGTISYATGEAQLVLTSPPDPGTSITGDSEIAAVTTDTQSLSPDVNGTVSGTIPGAPLLPGSIHFAWNVSKKSAYENDKQWNKSDFESTVIIARTAQDDGAGGFTGVTGSIDYTTGNFTLEVEADYTYRAQTPTGGGGGGGGIYRQSYSYSETVKQEILESAITIYFQPQSTVHATDQITVNANNLDFDLSGNAGGWSVVPGTVWFVYGGKEHYDNEGIIYRDLDKTSTGVGTAVGTIDYSTRTVTLATWENDPGDTVTIKTAALARGDVTTAVLVWRTPGRPLRPQSLQITAIRADTAAVITAQPDVNGDIDTAEIQGQVDTETGIIEIAFTDGVNDIPVWPGSVRYNAVIQSFLPLDASLIGIDPVRLPVDGRVPIFRDGGVAVLSHTADTNAGTPSDGQVVNLSRDYQAEIWVVDANGIDLDPAQYTVDLEAGTVTFANPVVLQDIDTNPLTTPLTIKDRIEHMSAVTDVQVSGEISFLAPLAHDYPIDSVLSSALLWGDIKSRVYSEFTQKTWNSSAPNWTEERIGDDTTASYNLVDNPIEVTNHGAIAEKWALVFTGTGTFNIVGETVGIIGTGTTASDTAPINLNTGAPYFTVKAAGWGSGWVSGNVFRFNTDGCLAPMWVARVILTGQATEENDEFAIQARGDAD